MLLLSTPSLRLGSPILDSLAGGVSVCDETGYLLYTNPAEDRLFGYDRGELIGQHWSVRTLENQRILSDVLAQVEREGVWVGDLNSRKKDGTTFISRAHFSILALGGRRLPLCLQADVSQERHAQEQLQNELRLDATGRLAGGIAHDLNNMLAAILGFSDLLDRALEPGDARRHDVEQIRVAATRSATLMAQLLAFARRDLIQPEHLDLNAVVRQAEAVVHFAAGARIDVRLQLAREVGTIFADARRVEQVLMNLVLNARDSMPRGGRLTIETSSLAIGSDAVLRYGIQIPPGRYATLAVADTGEGMEPGILARIWEPFFTTRPTDRGTGLGLAMVYGAVRQAGGFVWAESEPGKGTVMRVHWPEAGGLEH